MAVKFFIDPFAISGDRTPIPDAAQGDGSVSYTSGYGPDYELNRVTNPSALTIERQKMNDLFYEMTSNIQQYQINGTPEFITTADNGGTAFTYQKDARVFYDDGSGRATYISLVANNTALPSVTANWLKSSPGTAFSMPTVIAAGSVNSMTATYSPAIAAYTDGLILRLVSLGANTTNIPTVNVNGLGSKIISRDGAGTLVPGDTGNVGNVMILQYSTSLGNFVLLNPQSFVSAFNYKSAVLFQEQQPNGTVGGASFAATYGTRTLNTASYNNLVGSSLSANQITLQIGTYQVWARAPAAGLTPLKHRIKLQNITAGTAICFGSSSNTGTATAQTDSVINGQIFTLSSIAVIALQHWTSTAVTSTGLGLPVTSGDIEVYSEILLVKVG